jgi:predicted transcriptional regulator
MDEDFGMEEAPGPEPQAGGGRPAIEERIRELQAEGLSKEDIALRLMEEHYSTRDIVKLLHVSPRTLRKLREGGATAEAAAKRNADEAVIATAEAKALEEMKKWTGKEAHETLQELLALGKLVYGLGVRERAARRGMPLLDYVENALNFYDFWYGLVVELINLGVLSMDGFINGDAICYEEVTPA